MPKYARIEDKVAVELFVPLEGFTLEDHWPKEHAALFTEVPEEVTTNSVIDSEGNWKIVKEVVAPVPQAEPYKTIDSISFKLLFTVDEWLATEAKVQQGSDKKLNYYWNLLTDPQVKSVNLGLKATQDGLNYLVEAKMLTEERKAEILTGELSYV